MSTLPKDIQFAMRDCILKVMWAKKDIVEFFRGNGCTSSDMAVVEGFKDMNRPAIVDAMFNHLGQRADEGLGPLRAMLQALTVWSHFDPFYFEELKKLNRAAAELAISHLKQLQEIRDAKFKEERRERERREEAARAPQHQLPELKAKYIALLQNEMAPAARGYALEEILAALARLSELETTEPFRVNGEQIDGAVKYDGEHYIIEAKWQDKAASNEPVYQFAGKVEGKMYGRGIFVSVNGFSENVVASLVAGKAIKTIFVDGADLIIVLEGIIEFRKLLDLKIKAAQTKGLIYIDVMSGKSKV